MKYPAYWDDTRVEGLRNKLITQRKQMRPLDPHIQTVNAMIELLWNLLHNPYMRGESDEVPSTEDGPVR